MTTHADGAHDDWAERATERLAAAGYRRGGARHSLIRLLAAQNCALSAAELQEALAREQRGVSRASVYRIIEELERAELVARIEVGHGIVRFEPIRHGAGHHHHLVCNRCGRLMPFADEGLERELTRVSERVPLAVAEHEVILRGACASCAAAA
ncbi:MAG: transcriptional repressor [Solirubrobacteraceae bacterium]|jgi:Fur family ferric uptake transcriptional regulator